MTAAVLLAVVSSFLLLTPVSGQADIAWNVSNATSSGLTNIIFPISMPNAPHESGFYFAQQFTFGDSGGVGYTGLQPRPDSNGSSIVHAVFSSFMNGTTTDDSNCSDGADGGPGVSCSVDVMSAYSHTYELLVEKVEDTTWNGTLVDTVSGVLTHIGSYTLPPGTPGIGNSQIGFVEYYPWNTQPSHECSSLPYTSVHFGAPLTLTHGTGSGALSDAWEDGDCIGKVGFEAFRTSDGVEVTVGFK